jgi:hypothetical protein
MTVPITGFTINHILDELVMPLNTPTTTEELFLNSNITPDGLDNTYCPGSTPAIKLNNLRTKPYEIGKWRNYTRTSPFFVNSDIITFTGGKLHKINPITYEASYLGHMYAQSQDIAITSSKLWIYGSNYIHEYNITLNPFTFTFNRVILCDSQFLGAGMDAIDNNTLVTGGDGGVFVMNITGSTATFTFGFPIDGFVTGDILYDPINSVYIITVTKPKLFGFGADYFIDMYNLSGTRLIRKEFYRDGGWSLFLNPSNEIFLIRFTGNNYSEVFSLNRNTLDFTLITTIPNVTPSGASQIRGI